MYKHFKNRLLLESFLNLLYRLGIIGIDFLNFKDTQELNSFLAKLNEGQTVDVQTKPK